MDRLTDLDAVGSQPSEHSADELRTIIESYMGGIPVIVFRDDNKGWGASLNASPEIKARYEQRLQEVLSVMHEHKIILREEPPTPLH